MKFSDLKMGTKLALGFAPVLLLLALVAYVGISGFTGLQAGIEDLSGTRSRSWKCCTAS